eukprot:TRINITY_DN31869_c0_g1_i1.p1 TRINITY_DN31869_c0_g1~~TRINITY_DN31869_c0_g1_i1.p1  ORF type:complete len:307 (-),score=72.15 TRINITY_DN31869_c0_g1_i1:244-1083(-)
MPSSFVGCRSRRLIAGSVICLFLWCSHISNSFVPSCTSRRAKSAPQTIMWAAPVGSPTGEFTLRYFDGRGVAEMARMLFALAGESYEDKRYKIIFGKPFDFSTMQREEFDADKAAGRLDVAMGKVPVLESGEFVLPQSKAIERYLAKRFGMMGSNLEEEAWIDALAEHVRDINDAYNKKGIFFMKDEEKKAELKAKWHTEELPGFLQKLESAIPGADGFAIGSKTSLADVCIYKLLKDTYDEDVSAAYSECPKLQSIVQSIDKHEKLQKWIAERPQTMF